MLAKALQSQKENLQKLITELKNGNTVGIPMRLRLFLFLVVLVLTMFFGIIVILLVTGSFTVSHNQNIKTMQAELVHISQDVSQQLGDISVSAVDLSRGLSESIEKNLQQRGLTVTDLPDHPEILEDLIGKEYERLLFSLQKTKSSGAFMILDTTVNPGLENAAHSRAGLYMKNMEPNIISSTSPTIHILRGFPNIARQNYLPLHSQWAMEFDTREASYMALPLEQAKRHRLPLSRLYYWSPAVTLPGTSEEVMLCSIPLIDAKGNVFGVCGFEVSAMLFKLAYMPDQSYSSRLFCMLSPVKDNVLNTSEALISGGYLALKNDLTHTSIQISESKKSYNTYRYGDDTVFAGFHDEVKLYPKGSAFEDQKWAVSLILPQKDLAFSITHLNQRLTLLCLLLFVFGVICASFISRRYLKPITQGLDIIKSKNLSQAPITKIPEIDDLIQFLSVQSDKPSAKSKTTLELTTTVFDEFVENTKTLSPAERAVFDLYVKGHTAKEITQILCLSINTIKTHNKRIYMKLNVASREDLLNYVRRLKEMGKELE